VLAKGAGRSLRTMTAPWTSDAWSAETRGRTTAAAARATKAYFNILVDGGGVEKEMLWLGGAKGWGEMSQEEIKNIKRPTLYVLSPINRTWFPCANFFDTPA
jgi:hypothetical protein